MEKMELNEEALAVLERAGIECPADSYAQWMAQLDERVRLQLEETPELTEIRDGDDYRYCKSALAAMRKTGREIDAARKGLTGDLDKAKKAVMSFFKACTAPLDEQTERMSALQRSFEDGAREGKRERLQRWWEDTYPLLALCTGEAEEPLVPFARVFDPDWVKRLSEVNKDDAAHEAMAAIADGIASAQAEIEAAGLDPEVRTLALNRLFDTLDPAGNIAWATEQARRQRDLERVQAATVTAPAEQGPEPVQAPQEAPRPVRDERQRITLELPCEPGADRVLCVWCDSDEELHGAVAAMRAAGLHGCVGRAVL